MHPRSLSKQTLTQLLVIAMISFISINCLSSDTAFTSEIDSWTGRKELLDRGKSEQTIIKLNYITKKFLGQGVELANNKGKGECDETALYDNVYDELTNFLIGEVEKMIQEDEDFAEDRVTVPLKGSIYQDFTFMDAFLLRLTSLSFVSVINVNGNIVGSDKFGHFFAQGYTNFKRAYINTNNHGISDALDHGFNSERLYFGLQTDSIFSYADLSAGYEGMNFWKRLLGTPTNIDDTRIERKPYVGCKDGKWEINPETSFQWEDYVGPGCDEAINCSFFRTQEIYQKR